MRGEKEVTVVRGGQRIVVVEVRDPWVGAYVFADGERKAGWLRTTDLIPVNDSAKPKQGQVCLCAMQTVTPAPPTVTAACRVSGGPGPDYFRDYNAGYYDRHEVDPNLTVWEPWMH